MKIVAAPNALKGSLSAFDAAAAIAEGARRAYPLAEVVELGIADGGDGTAEVLRRAKSGTFREVVARDPLGRVFRARYAWLPDATAVIDVATASGLTLLTTDERSALTASSFGTGELMRAALDAGARRIVLGVGGSATVDGGAGILQALGARLLDGDGHELPPGGSALQRLARLDVTGLVPRALEVPLDVACDVDSTLLGEHGAARMFGPQKGASPADVEQLEAALARFGHIVARDFGRDPTTVTSGGAAGGIAGGLYGVLGARLFNGIELVLDALAFDAALEGAALCLTAEGRIDRQSLRQKGPLGVARRAAARGVPVVALAGDIAADLNDRDFPEISGIFSICPRPMSAPEAMRDAFPLLARATERIVRLFRRGSDKRETEST